MTTPLRFHLSIGDKVAFLPGMLKIFPITALGSDYVEVTSNPTQNFPAERWLVPHAQILAIYKPQKP